MRRPGREIVVVVVVAFGVYGYTNVCVGYVAAGFFGVYTIHLVWTNAHFSRAALTSTGSLLIFVSSFMGHSSRKQRAEFCLLAVTPLVLVAVLATGVLLVADPDRERARVMHKR